LLLANSPDLNPIEQVFAKLKAPLRHARWPRHYEYVQILPERGDATAAGTLRRRKTGLGGKSG
jgi:transposase